ncbi:DgyrCDS1944 [Dimorphilus gyrociliatus]|uniref:DgyrCDS1944 n=1 Tax=Dimorphilus gyrociliatus TaxID=2664684 RepID=A0A7I8VBX4_9ANNE|nr:DgyrCDS1944 [Dimorphilus gyrociliatus]
MDWDTKFATIVDETESTLMRIRESIEFGRSLKLPDSINEAKSKTITTSYGNKNIDLFRDFENDRRSASRQDIPALISLMQDRIDTQNKTIDHLSKNLLKLEEDRDTQQRQMRNFREELSIVRERLSERGVDLQTEHKFEQWKRELASQIQMLQGRMSLMSHSTNDSPLSSSIHRDFIDLKRHVNDELRSLRNEIDTLKARLSACEVHVGDAFTDKRFADRSLDRLERKVENGNMPKICTDDMTIRDLAESQSYTKRTLNRLQDEQNFDKHQINLLKKDVRINPESISPSILTRKKHVSKNEADINELDLDETDDTLDTDFEITDTADLIDCTTTFNEFNESKLDESKFKLGDDITLNDLDTTDFNLTTDIDLSMTLSQ